MIKSFRNEAAEAAWRRRFIKGVPKAIIKAANCKLTQINSARTLSDLRAPPGNRLEALTSMTSRSLITTEELTHG